VNKQEGDGNPYTEQAGADFLVKKSSERVILLEVQQTSLGVQQSTVVSMLDC
jgi:hypothetical protein